MEEAEPALSEGGPLEAPATCPVHSPMTTHRLLPGMPSHQQAQPRRRLHSLRSLLEAPGTDEASFHVGAEDNLTAVPRNRGLKEPLVVILQQTPSGILRQPPI